MLNEDMTTENIKILDDKLNEMKEMKEIILWIYDNESIKVLLKDSSKIQGKLRRNRMNSKLNYNLKEVPNKKGYIRIEVR